MRLIRCFFALLALATLTYSAWAQAHPTAPAFNSRPGAPYTMYLNFSGFSFTNAQTGNTWGGQTPGVTPAYNGQAGATFTTTEQANIKNIWTRISDAYSMFDINVTTVDPAVAAGQAANDVTRFNYYEATPRMMHTVIGDGASTFFGNAGGVSYVGVMHNASDGSGYHTNWAFVNRLGGVNAFHNIFTASSHELGHAASLSHQGDYTASSQVADYSTNNGSGVIAPTMGVAYSAARSVWRVGHVGVTTVQNDPLSILTNNPSLNGYVNDGIGRSQGTATPLPMNGSSINNLLANGVIVPASTTNPNPIGEANYTSGYYSFTTSGGIANIILNAGRQAITPGVPDPDAALDGTLRILDSMGNIIAQAATSSLGETININLPAGSYYIQVASAGGKQASLGPTGTWLDAQFFDMGSYFLSGVIPVAVPEPATLALLGASCMGVGFWWRKRRQVKALEAKVR